MDNILSLLSKLCAHGIIRPLDYQFALFVAKQSDSDNACYEAWLAGITSYQLSLGHICFPVLSDDNQLVNLTMPFPLSTVGIESELVSLEEVDWLSVISRSSVIGSPSSKTPLIFDGKRLYLHRYWFYESNLANRLVVSNDVMLSQRNVQRLNESLGRLFTRSYSHIFQAIKALPEQSENYLRRILCEMLDVVDEAAIEWGLVSSVVEQAKTVRDLAMLDRLIPESATLNWQKVAAAVAISQPFSVISGGPGTGKTTTVAKLLAALVEASVEQESPPTIKLVAPTGKAAARLTESIGMAIENLPIEPNIREHIPTQAGTIHRLLGAIPNRANFRHDKSNPLHLDILIVDEASMVDLSLMYKLFDAIPSHAKVILLGDKDQLASVEAGAVLGDICSFQKYGYSASHAKLIEQLTGFQAKFLQGKGASPVIANSLCMLQKSYRFNSRSGIGQLAKSVNKGNGQDIVQALESDYSDVHFSELSASSYQFIIDKLIEEYQPYLSIINDDVSTDTENQAALALRAFSKCRMLCAVRDGDFGVYGVNERVEKRLRARKKIRITEDSWYPGRPVMIIKNDHNLGVYNGDIGLCMNDEQGRLKVYFDLPDGTVKGILPSRLPQHETAYAMTIHKSQGSEFDTTLLMLPPEYSPIVTRELIYTGITRAKSSLYLLANKTVFLRGVKTLTSRASGLADLLS
ncbi:exodeoxyribonuclease V subunit alpha [Vibrio viridaestus]|uniref:RecBCD enzyme subunit RecD n=1 Tax=Vibrio viridaestus TaxID=2487322 RepID=A0A3N9THV6_9VIBR|nr:exodeoxyribonuclease V subunit alpha [Vibrio viridaestus]RQW63105.1 exodeoxyribonuclease V subunit alpha [Vibrio viridaestus]